MWDKIKEQIKRCVGYHFDKSVDIDLLVDILKKVLEGQIGQEYKIDGLAYQYVDSIYKILDYNSTGMEQVNSLLVLKSFEPFLKKVLYYLDNEQFLNVFTNQQMGIAIINALELNPDNIYLDEDHLNEFNFTKDDFEYYLIKVYLLRNSESHNAEVWTPRKIGEAIEDILIFYLEVINRFQEQLKQKIPEAENDFSKYIDEKIKEFEEWRTKFIPTNMEENSSLYEGIATEDRSIYEHNNDSESTSDDEDVDENVDAEDDITGDGYDNSNPGKSEKERSGTVDQIRKENLPERCMMLWGEAGLGKSTTLQYLTYIDAQAYKEGKSDKIPVYIPLGNLIQENITIENSVFSELGIGVDVGRNLLENGQLNIFLDGVNEIPKNVRSVREREIQTLLDSQSKLATQKKSLIIISNRPEGNSSFSNIPIFNLKPLSDDQIFEFIEKNTKGKDEKIINIIKKGIEENPKFKNSIKTPLMAMKLINIVIDKKKFPETEHDLIGAYLKGLYERERIEKHDINFSSIDRIHYLLAYLAAYGKRKNESNSGINKEEVINCFNSCMKDNNIHNIDVFEILNLLIEMGVLSCNSEADAICFSHESYQDYYAQRAIEMGLFLIDEDSKKKLQ